jgi:hypothetical protein
MQQEPRWPTVIGTIGIVIGIILLIDTVDDVVILGWTAEDWRRIFAPHVADLIARAVPSFGMRVLAAVTKIGLGTLLIVGSIGLRHRRRIGIPLSRLWAWLAIVWLALRTVREVVWFRQHGGELPPIGAVSPQVYVSLAAALAAAMLLAFPVFLLVWLSRPAVRAEYESWPR